MNLVRIAPHGRRVADWLSQAVAVWAVACGWTAAASAFELQRGDHIALIGNTLAERMQHDGWLETLIHARFPEHDLSFRNLGFSGDELTFRQRSAGFGSPDHHLTATKTDVVFAFFGFNESFAGAAGLPKFKQDLKNFIQHTLAQKYNGRSAPRLVLFSPIAHEDLQDRNLPDGKENNERIALYTQAMAEAAQEAGVTFVDLYRASRELYARAARPLTINGIHLTAEGNRQLGEAIVRGLFPQATPRLDGAGLEKLRQVVLDKNFHWFNRHRTVDGYSIYGGRADLRFVDGQTNRVVMQREMEILDVMTANRDRRIWAVARGGEAQVDDGNTPPFLEVKTNKPGPLPGGKHVFLDAEAAIGKMTVAKGMKVNLFASEQQFLQLANPVQIAFDARGRMWVAVMPSYPHWKPKEPMSDKVLILEDADGDGRADKCTVFADKLHVPTGLELWNGGVLVGQQPDLMFLKDTDGDDVADVRERVVHGLDSADTHHAMNSFVFDPGGALYFQEGTFHHTQVETLWGVRRCANAGVFRYEPRTHKFDVYVSYSFANPHGHVFDRWGQDFVTDGTGNVNYYATAFSGHVDFPNKHPGMKPFFQQWTRPCPGTEILSSRHFPDENQGNYLVGNVIGFQGIMQYKFRDEGSGFAADEVERIVSSSDPNFRPTDIEIGPDGAIYFSDWQNPIIGHMQHNLRDPSRDTIHGRVYRITYPSRPLLKPAKIAGEPIEKLLDLLKEPEDRVRYRAKIELGARKSEDVMAALDTWVAALDKNDKEYEHHLLEALWVCQWHNVVNETLLNRMLTSTDFRARAAAARVLCYWRDRVPYALEQFKKLAADEHPRVRLEAVRAASFFTQPEAVEVALISAEHPTDYYLDYTRGETLKTLEKHWKRALAEGRKINVTSEAGARFFLRSMSVADLLKMDRTKAISLELLLRSGVRDEVRRDALASLAKLESKRELDVLLGLLGNVDGQRGVQDESVVFDLVRLLTMRRREELASIRPALENLATHGKLPILREIGYVALIAADGGVEKAWALGTRSPAALRDLVAAMPLISDPSVRASLYPKVGALVDALPPHLSSGSGRGKGTLGRFVRVEIPRDRATLTLAEVEVYSGGKNVARSGRASQKNTSSGGRAERGIDGKTSGEYSAGGQTHTQESTRQPWWEVDLRQAYPIESIVVYNRTDGSLGKRLDGFSLKILDADRQVVWSRDNLPAPDVKAEYEVAGGGLESAIRREAMLAMTHVRGQEAATFKTLAKFVRDPHDRQAAIAALTRLPRDHWPKEDAKPLLDTLLAYIRTVPTADRTSPAALDAIQFADALASLLPAAEAKPYRAALGDLGVRIIRLGTKPEQMQYDQDRIVVQAGKPVEFFFENTDLMPHNFVITQPGALQEVGLLAEATATDPDAMRRQFVPRSPKILLASNLLQPRQAQKLSFTAPTKPGVYPYVCTYPGHWRRMYGALYVVASLDEYLADPEGYVKTAALPIADELLKNNRPRKEWKLEELAVTAEELSHGRNLGNGRQMFQVATCVACHKYQGVGTEIGPDLAKLDAKYKPLEILKELLEPSTNINEKYQSHAFELEDGRTITGLIVEETPTMVKVLENPLAKTAAIEIAKSEISQRRKSPVSIMPKGLLNKLTREEILDLVAYVNARGNDRDPAFAPAHDHDHGAGH